MTALMPGAPRHFRLLTDALVYSYVDRLMRVAKEASMATPHIRVDQETYDWLKRRASGEQKPTGAVVSDLIQTEERQAFRQAMADASVRLRQDPVAWAEYKRAFEEWDVTLMDGLKNEPPYYEDGKDTDGRAATDPVR
jgi:hypothetical protein